MRYRFAGTMLLACSMSSAYATENRLQNVWYTSARVASNPELLVQSFLLSKAAELGIKTSSLKLAKTQESLLAYHLTYQQYVNTKPVLDATISVSVLKKDQAVFQYYSSLVTGTTPVLLKQTITEEQAYDAAWAYVGVQARLFQAPKSKLQYVRIKNNLVLVYSVSLSPTAPYGAWRIDVDAATGDVLNVEDLRITEKSIPIPASFGTKVTTIDRKQAFASWANTLKEVEPPVEFKNGTAKVFDPDPKTFLGNSALTDTSPSAAFTDAYVQRVLPDLKFSNGNYSLSGPWTKLIDFDPPTAAPTTTRDGKWNFVRGKGGFTDAMSYFHIDQSQRYIQSLGFKDATGIQFGPIEVDTDGVDGQDNSYFQPGTNQLAFGHGCVDDNEDADVILHEYGHAIHFSINSNWSGGDTGAMGEGFGDYWASSYSYSTAEGHDFEPTTVYNWDAGSCWPGRRTDALDARYNTNQSYGAHTGITGGRQSDELWSTPIFQAHIALRALNVPREEIDTIILEAQFGLGSGITMRQMAQSIVATAARLYPYGPHAATFREKFIHHNIMVEPKPELTATLETVQDGDGIVDPGERPTFPLKISNIGDKIAEAVDVDITTDDAFVSDLVIDQTTDFVLGNVDAGKFKYLTLTFALAEGTPCGHMVELKITLKSKDGKSWVVPAVVQVGKAIEAAVTSEPNVAIPDRGTVSDKVEVDSTAKVSANFTVAMNVKHTYIGDLEISLTSPEGKTILLHDNSGSSTDNIIGSYPKTLTPKDPFSKLLGQKLDGTWTLKVQDTSASDTGSLLSWGIRDVSGYECHADSSAD